MLLSYYVMVVACKWFNVFLTVHFVHKKEHLLFKYRMVQCKLVDRQHWSPFFLPHSAFWRLLIRTVWQSMKSTSWLTLLSIWRLLIIRVVRSTTSTMYILILIRGITYTTAHNQLLLYTSHLYSDTRVPVVGGLGCVDSSAVPTFFKE